MKKWTPYIIGGVVLVSLIVLVLTNKPQTQQRRFDPRVTLKQEDKIPYGYFVARNFLPSLFPTAEVSIDKKMPGYWDSIAIEQPDQLVVLSAFNFNADDDELENIFQFAKKGNHVFIIARNLSYDAENFFNCDVANVHTFEGEDFKTFLEDPPFNTNKAFSYPGILYESFFSSVDTATTKVLGRNKSGLINFIQLNAGNGSIYMHLNPLTFSNYFILYKNNVQYYQQVFSIIPKEINRVAWNEYYLLKPNEENKEDEPNTLGVLMRYPAFKWGLLTAIFTLLIFVLLEMRRRQRIIPVITKPANDSLEFVKTIGRLYHDRRDHHNLAKKMAVYFLDHVRSHYKLQTGQLDEAFVNALHVKSGYPVENLLQITGFIKRIKELGTITEKQLSDFHKQLELFYQNT